MREGHICPAHEFRVNNTTMPATLVAA
jgi:hypothetical protein